MPPPSHLALERTRQSWPMRQGIRSSGGRFGDRAWLRLGTDSATGQSGQPVREERPFGLVVSEIERGTIGYDGLGVSAEAP